MKTEYNYEDQSLLLAIKNGNEKAFDTLFRKYYPMLCAYGNKFVELEDAEECVQDAMLWLWENKDMLVIQSSLSNYLFSIVHHRAINRIKQQEVKSRVENYFYEEMQSLIDDTNFYLIEVLKHFLEKGILKIQEDISLKNIYNGRLNILSVNLYINIESQDGSYSALINRLTYPDQKMFKENPEFCLMI